MPDEAAASERIILRPERLVAGGDALARLDDGRVAFVRGALPGDVVVASVVDDRRDFVRAVVDQVTTPSVGRVEPTCPHRKVGCGGCTWMHLAVGSQLDAKAEIVAESLRRIAGLASTDVDRLLRIGDAVPAVGARTTVRVVGGPDRRVGFRAEHDERVVPIDTCEVAHPSIGRMLPDLRVEPGIEVSLRTSVATGQMTARWERPRRSGRIRTTGRTRTPAPGSPDGPVVGLPGHVAIGDRATLVERVADANLRVSAASFFQSGPAAAELLVEGVRRAAPELADAQHAVDAYAGVGLFAATAMSEAAHITLVESSASSIGDAAENLRHRGETVTIERSEVGRWRPPLRGAEVDVVVADPARSGLGKPGADALVAAEPAVLVLVSCDPASLARDTRLLRERGYRPGWVEVLDLFPQTHHVETVTRFTP